MDKGNVKVLIDILKFLFPAGILVSLCLYCYNSYLVSPKISYACDEENDIFSVQTDFRGISMRVYPQMLICYGNYVILVTHLEGYYEQEFVYFDNNKTCYAKKNKQEYSDKLMQYIRNSVLEKLNETYDESAMREINDRLIIFVSLIGGVQYENQLGNSVKQYCIIELNGLVKDYSNASEEITNRLYENEIVLDSGLDEINENGEINQMVEVITKEVTQLYERDNL